MRANISKLPLEYGLKGALEIYGKRLAILLSITAVNIILFIILLLLFYPTGNETSAKYNCHSEWSSTIRMYVTRCDNATFTPQGDNP